MKRRFSSAQLGLATVMACALPLPFASAARATPTYSTAYDRCMKSGDAGQGITSGIIDCTNEEYARHDTILNQVYGATMARLSPARRAQLRKFERAWLFDRPRRCDHDQMVDGEIGQIQMHECYLDETIARTAWLRRFK